MTQTQKTMDKILGWNDPRVINGYTVLNGFLWSSSNVRRVQMRFVQRNIQNFIIIVLIINQKSIFTVFTKYC